MERTIFTAGSQVRGGFYINRDKLDLIVIAGKQGLLPDEAGRYTRIPMPAALLLGVLFGGLFVAAAPCIAILRLVRRFRRSTWPRLQRNGRRLASWVASWRQAKPAPVDEPPPQHDANP
jgi:hypothetical protein